MLAIRQKKSERSGANNMAGTLLFLSKDSGSHELYQENIQRLEHFINQYYNRYFRKISFHHTGDGALLVEFRKNDRIKIFTDDKGNWLTFEGTVFARGRTKAYNANELLTLYLQAPTKFPHDLDGHFVIKVYDASRNIYRIVNNILKNKINYFIENDQFILFTPFIILSGILNKPKPDLYAFNEFMWRYYILSERSVFKNLRKLTAASIYEINKGRITYKNYWDWPEAYLDIPFQTAVDQMTESMKESAQLIHHTFDKPCIDFTMGQDTRQVVAAFTNLRLPMTTSIFGKKDFYEVQKINEVSKRHDIEHHNIKLSDDYLKET